MNYTTLGALIEMGGYGRYVWPAYGFTLCLMWADAWSARRRIARAMAQASTSTGHESEIQ